MLEAVIVHPDQRVVISLCPEMTIKQDSTTKQDCEKQIIHVGYHPACFMAFCKKALAYHQQAVNLGKKQNRRSER
jgi:hypothetical protein